MERAGSPVKKSDPSSIARTSTSRPEKSGSISSIPATIP